MAPLPVSEYSAFPTILPTLIHTRSSAGIFNVQLGPVALPGCMTESQLWIRPGSVFRACRGASAAWDGVDWVDTAHKVGGLGLAFA